MLKATRHRTGIIACQIAGLLLMLGCASGGQLLVAGLDPMTGVTVTRAASPMVFYRDTSARAAYARDYVNFGPLEVNRMGQHQYFVWLGIWSTLPGWDAVADRDDFETVTVFADGEPLQLAFAGWSIDSIGSTETAYVKPVASSIDAYYSVTIDQVALIAAAHEVRVHAGTGRAASYVPWQNQPAAVRSLQEFVRHARE